MPSRDKEVILDVLSKELKSVINSYDSFYQVLIKEEERRVEREEFRLKAIKGVLLRTIRYFMKDPTIQKEAVTEEELLEQLDKAVDLCSVEISSLLTIDRVRSSPIDLLLSSEGSIGDNIKDSETEIQIDQTPSPTPSL